MKVWMVCMLLCAAVALWTTEGAVVAAHQQNELPEEAVVAEHQENLNELPEENGELSDEELAAAAENEEQNSGPVNSIADRSVFCPSGWLRYGSRCFLLVKSARTWLAAENYCVTNQAVLASVQSYNEYTFLQSLLTVGGVSNAWIGAYNFQNTWLWIDRAGFYYTNWQSLNSVSSYPCAYMSPSAGWANTYCGYAYPFFCSLSPRNC